MSLERPYEHAAPLYLKAGWTSPIPTGRAGERAAKHPVPKKYTGRAAIVPEPDVIARWRETHAVNNIALHLPLGVIGIDVDHYGDKRGGDVLAELEAELGSLPPTVRSSARGADNPGGIRFFRAPEIEFIGKIAGKERGGIEIVQAHHRYAVVWPSIHPETGDRYEWYTPGGKALGRPPRFDALPALPGAAVAA